MTLVLINSKEKTRAVLDVVKGLGWENIRTVGSVENASILNSRMQNLLNELESFH